MQVFNLYFKIFKNKMKIALMYILIFIVIFCALSMVSRNDNAQTFNATKVDIAVVDQDESDLSKNLYSYLDEKANIVSLNEEDSSIKDALFFNQIACAITIPEGFENNFEASKLALLSEKRPDDVNAFLIDRFVDTYLNNVENYKKLMPNASYQDVHTMVKGDLDEQVDMEIGSFVNENSYEATFLNYYFNYLGYIFLAIVILIIGTIMICIYRSDIRRRTFVSPISNISYNLQLIAANFIAVFIIWAIFICSVFIISSEVFSTLGGLLILNSFIFIFVVLALSYLIANLLSDMSKSDDALNGIANLVALGSSFMCGAFVPQSVLPEGVLNIASFNPMYWFIRFNNEVCSALTFDNSILQTLFGYLGIQILFGIAMLVLALVISRSKRSSKEV